MDLALEFKTPVESLRRIMTERELGQWYDYASKKLLPSRRREIYLAQIASVIAQSVGNEVSIADFVLDFTPKKKRKPTKESAGALAAMMPGLGVRKLGQGRKKKATNG